MGKKKLPEASVFQLRYEKILLIAAWILGTFHMLLSAFRYAINYAEIRPYERWFGLALLAGSLACLVITWVKYPATRYRVKRFFHRMRSFEMVFMVGLCCWFVIVCAVRQNTDHVRYFQFGDWWLFDTVVIALILFPMAGYAGREKAEKMIRISFQIVVLLYTVFTGWGLWNVFHLNVITLPSGSQIGMTRKMELDLGCMYNLTGAISFTVLALACYLAAAEKKRPLRILWCLAAVIQLFAALLSNSRTIYVALLFMAAGTAFFAGMRLARGQKIVSRVAISLGAALLCGGIMWALRAAVFNCFDSITHFSAMLHSAAEGVASAPAAEEYVRDLNNLSGRENVWMSSLKVMVSSPMAFLFGVTPFSVTEALQELGGLRAEVAHAHNVILQFAVSFGVPAAIVFVVFLGRMTVKCVRSILRFNRSDYFQALMIAAAVGSFLLVNMAEAYLVGYFSLMSCAFFTLCGVVVQEEKEVE